VLAVRRMNSIVSGETDIWDAGSYDSDSDYKQNDTPPPDIDTDFRNNMLNIKHKLYEMHINEPDDRDDNLDNYMKMLNTLYVMTINAQKDKMNPPETLNQFPPELQEQIGKILVWIQNYFKKNEPCDTIKYEDYIRKTLHDYQFIQHNSFE
jgi:hypothetical protein